MEQRYIFRIFGQNIPPLCLPPLLPVVVVSSNSSGGGGVGGGEYKTCTECRTASRSSESVPVCPGPTRPLSTVPPRVMSHPNILRQQHDCRRLLSRWHRAAVEPCYLDLWTSRQDGRYLSNSMVRLAFSDWTSLLSIQLETGGFQPRSAGFMYRMPGERSRPDQTRSHLWTAQSTNTFRVACYRCWGKNVFLTPH